MSIVMTKDLFNIRVDLNISQAKLADEAGLNTSTIYQAENGSPISRKSARKIITALQARGIQVESPEEIKLNVSESSKR